MAFQLTLDPEAVERVVGRLNEDYIRDEIAPQLVKDVRGNISQKGRVASGKMLNSVQAAPLETKTGEVTVTVFSNVEYTMFQEEGVRGPVLPVRAKVLRFKPAGSASFVFAKSTSGFSGMHAFSRALQDFRL